MLRTLGGLFILLVGCFAGCSSGTTVSGHVTLDGKPLSKGTITFSSKGEAPSATGTINSSGNYSLSVGTSSKITPGTYQVTIVATELVPPTPTDPSPLPKKLTPAKYEDPSNAEMVREVKQGSNKFDFELKSM